MDRKAEEKGSQIKDKAHPELCSVYNIHRSIRRSLSYHCITKFESNFVYLTCSLGDIGLSRYYVSRYRPIMTIISHILARYCTDSHAQCLVGSATSERTPLQRFLRGGHVVE